MRSYDGEVSGRPFALFTARTVIRYPEQETLEWAEAYLTSPQGWQTWAQRGAWRRPKDFMG
jgi:hypothetical protein